MAGTEYHAKLAQDLYGDILDVAQNSNVYLQGQHYGVPGVLVDGQNMEETLKAGRVTVDYVRKNGPAILQINTYRLTGHSPADPEHERGRKAEKNWARENADPLKIFEATALEAGLGGEVVTDEELTAIKKKVQAQMKVVLDFEVKFFVHDEGAEVHYKIFSYECP